MNVGKSNIAPNSDADVLDISKLKGILKRNWLWFIILFFVFNFSAYLYMRWTKPLYEASSEIKLDVETDATEFGLGNFFEDKNLSILSGEIELLKSRLFFKSLIDSLTIDVGYFTTGRVLVDEKYPNSPISIKYKPKSEEWLDRPIYLNFINDNEFQISLEPDKFNGLPSYFIEKEVDLPEITLIVTANERDFNPQENGFYFIIHSYEALQSYFESNLKVELLNLKANTIKISFTDHNANKARDMINAINNLYINYTQNEKSLANNKKIGWINQQLSKIESQLEGYEDFFEGFTIENRTSNLDEDLKNTIIQINHIDSNRFHTKNMIALYENLRMEFEGNTTIASPSMYGQDIKSVIAEYNDLLIQKEQMGLTYKETTFAMQEVNQKLDITLNNMKELISSKLKELNKNLNDLSIQKSRLEKQFSQIPEKSTELNKNERFYHLYESFYMSLMQSKAEFEIAIAGITPNFKILSPASIPSSPIYPRPVIVYGIGMVSSFLFSFLFIAVKYLVEDKIETIEQVESLLSFNIIGSIPKSKHTTEDKRLVVSESPKSGVSESLRSIRTNLQFIIPDKSQKVISVTSSVGGEGKTFVTLNMAAILALTKKKVVVLDLDMRKPQVENSLKKGINKDLGVSTILINKHQYKECLIMSDVDGMYYIPSGPTPPNPSELLLNGEFTNLLESLKEEFDYILLDTPPIGLVTDGILAMKNSDLTLMVIRSGYTSKKDIKHTLRHVPFNESKISVVLNGIDRSSVYGYNYGYYTDKAS